MFVKKEKASVQTLEELLQLEKDYGLNGRTSKILEQNSVQDPDHSVGYNLTIADTSLTQDYDYNSVSPTKGNSSYMTNLDHIRMPSESYVSKDQTYYATSVHSFKSALV